MRAPKPIAWHVARWGDDPWSLGSWTFLRPGGSPADRATLGQPVDDRLVLAGEATNASQPAMVHGAYESGVRAAEWCRAIARAGERVVVVGAGAGGLGAARALADAGMDVVVLEARRRVGGRVHSVVLDGVPVDMGAAWLQQWARNPLAQLVERAGLTTVPTDFSRPLVGATSGDVERIAAESAALRQLLAAAGGDAADGDDQPLADVLAAHLAQLDEAGRRAAESALDADLVLEAGVMPVELSARWAAREPGVGAGDRWLPEGYGRLVEMVASGIDVRLDHAVERIEWTSHGAVVTGPWGDLRADRCICNIPIALIAAGRVELVPGLPPAHLRAMGRIGTGVVEKVALAFEERWWPASPTGYLRWYAEPPSWTEWLDLTDGCGRPVVAGLIAADAVRRHHHGRTDEEIALAATSELARWAAAVEA